MSRLFPIFVILFAIGIYFAYLSPTYKNQIQVEQASIKTDDQALAAASAFTAKENELIAERNQIPPASLARLQEFLPNGVDNVQLILDLNSLASRSGLTLSNFVIQDNSGIQTTGTINSFSAPTVSTSTDPSALESTNPINSLDLSVSATGTYASFRSFLSAAELSLRPLDVVKLTVKDSATGAYTYDITFRIYWLH